MTDHRREPPGLGRRERRLSDQETERRMLAAAVAMVHRTGLAVSLDHLSFEDVIRNADVARSAVYRRRPYKDLFFGGCGPSPAPRWTRR
jgi:AcrR family transcriptional regulator